MHREESGIEAASIKRAHHRGRYYRIQMDSFVPRPALANGHRMTLYSWGNPRHFPQLPPPTRRYFDVAPDARVLAECHWQEQPRERPTPVALPGPHGSSEAHCMRGPAPTALG